MKNDKEPLIIAFVSGKGGVGKTMLAVAAAKELSEARRTLLVDLDFFNRGLTGLLKGGTSIGSIQRPSFLAETKPGAVDPEWQLTEVARNLVHVEYPDLPKEDIEKFELLEVRTLSQSILRFAVETAALARCDCVILDCHGGPDNSSFAACLLADFTVLVSEPDRITFYGTLHFLRRLEHVRGSDTVDIRLVFNKVVAGFSGFFLSKFYDEHVRDLFHGKPLLAIFPLEVYLTKEFEKEPLLTRVYPNSFLATKTQQLLFDLLREQYAEVLPASVRGMPNWLRKYRRYALGRRSPIMSLDVIFGTLATFILLLLSAGWLESFLAPRVHDVADQIVRLELAVLVAHTPHFFERYSSEVQAALGGQLPAADVLTDIDHALYDAQLRSMSSGKTNLSSARFSTLEDRRFAEEKVREQWDELSRIQGLSTYEWHFRYRLYYMSRFREFYSTAREREFRVSYWGRMSDPREEVKHLQELQRYVSQETFRPPAGYTFYAADAAELKKTMTGTSTYIWGYLTRFTGIVESEWIKLVFFGWFILAIVTDQTERLDRRFVYAVRKKHIIKGIAFQILEWGLRLFAIGLLLFVMKNTTHEYTRIFVSVVLLFSILCAMVVHTYSAYRQIRYERRWSESVIRVGILLAIIGIGAVSSRL